MANVSAIGLSPPVRFPDSGDKLRKNHLQLLGVLTGTGCIVSGCRAAATSSANSPLFAKWHQGNFERRDVARDGTDSCFVTAKN